jgi:hypothetical protein
MTDFGLHGVGDLTKGRQFTTSPEAALKQPPTAFSQHQRGATAFFRNVHHNVIGTS